MRWITRRVDIALADRKKKEAQHTSILGAARKHRLKHFFDKMKKPCLTSPAQSDYARGIGALFHGWRAASAFHIFPPAAPCDDADRAGASHDLQRWPARGCRHRRSAPPGTSFNRALEPA